MADLPFTGWSGDHTFVSERHHCNFVPITFGITHSPTNRDELVGSSTVDVKSSSTSSFAESVAVIVTVVTTFDRKYKHKVESGEAENLLMKQPEWRLRQTTRLLCKQAGILQSQITITSSYLLRAAGIVARLVSLRSRCVIRCKYMGFSRCTLYRLGIITRRGNDCTADILKHISLA